MNKTLLASAIGLAFGIAGTAWANPTNNGAAEGSGGTQTAEAHSDQSGQTGAGVNANEYAKVWQGNSKDSGNSDSSQSNSNNADSSTNNSNNNKSKNLSQSGNDGDAKAKDYGTAANNSSNATSNFNNAFNTNKAVAVSKLEGMVTKVMVHGLGNNATNNGNADGAMGGKGGKGYGGSSSSSASGGTSTGGNGARPTSRAECLPDRPGRLLS